MKAGFIFLVLLIVCISCGTNNKPMSDAQKEKIKGEVKEVVNAFIKGCEEANADMVMESFLDSPDFVDLTNGMTFNYKEIIAMKPNFNAIVNQKCTIINEKYTFLDKSTVLYTAETKWSTNYKDGHSSITDPQVFLFTFKKIDNKWRIIYLVDSNVEKIVSSESAKGLNQVELMKLWIGTWECNISKDTTAVWVETSYGAGLEGIYKFSTKGKTYMEGKEFAGYDKRFDKYIAAQMIKGKDIEVYAVWFSSKSKCILLPFSDISNPQAASFRTESTFISPDIEVDTTFVNNKPVKTETWTKVK